MNLLNDDYYDERPDGDISDEVLARVASKAFSNTAMVPMGNQFFIRVTRSYPDENTDGVNGVCNLELIFMGPQKGGELILGIGCSDMLQVMAHTAKLIEDRKALRWDKDQHRWVF
jgi:hypothetical protein